MWQSLSVEQELSLAQPRWTSPVSRLILEKQLVDSHETFTKWVSDLQLGFLDDSQSRHSGKRGSILFRGGVN